VQQQQFASYSVISKGTVAFHKMRDGKFCFRPIYHLTMKELVKTLCVV
jgi:hypothetical protein